ncbi:hypothetical protein EPUL_002563 [Erysiphe pulchra]|uniref:XPG-I domain-containing protein n=1 Tax=Erysiphe pulchra TaxID=225359 RepID=A0A2S4PXN8_9PEZI|nr:hypothetical protein EPUL_002563 [Erysiphe pulchra]
MGIKGIYGEIGAGERIALSKLAVEKYEKTGRPLRIAIDIAIWQFQIQAGKGGSDPAIRTLYYRLLRLLALTIQPLFVFDGPNKPPLKRNKRTGSSGGSVSNMLTKQLLHYFGFPYHYAPGEAEAECALLQQNGIVDAVFSEDVDTLMFGSELCLRNWSSEDSKGNKAPTHISAYFKKAVSDKYGLDREGMILIALMSGGDYNTEGIPGCGIKLACEAARAGFGKSLCQIARSDAAGYKLWRENLSREINTNSSKLFKTKHNKLKIPENFPDKEILGYYTHPIVSNAAKILRLREEIQWHGKVDVPGLRRFVAEAFEWTYKPGAIKFIRGLAPALLVHKLRLRGDATDIEYGDVILTAMNETEIVRNICGRRVHFSSDGIDELRLIYHPLDIVGINLEMEQEEPRNEFGRNGLASCNSEDFVEDYLSNEDKDNRPGSPSRSNSTSYDPTQPDKLWVPRTIARVGVPLKVEDYEDALRDPKKFLKAKSASKKAMTKRSIPSATLNKKIKESDRVEVSEPISKNEQEKSDLFMRSTSNTYSHTDLDTHTTSNLEKKNAKNLLISSTKSVAIIKSNSSTSRKPGAKTKIKSLDTGKAHSNSIKSLAFNRVTKPQIQNHKKENGIVASKTSASISTTSPIFNRSTSEKKSHSGVSKSSFQLNGKTQILPSKNFGQTLKKDSHFLSQPDEESSTSRLSSPELPDISTLSLQYKKKATKNVTSYSTNLPPQKSNSPCSTTTLTSYINKDKTNTSLAKIKTKSKLPVYNEHETSRKDQNLRNVIAIPSSPLSLPSSKPYPCKQAPSSSQYSTPHTKKTILLRDSLPGVWEIVDSNKASNYLSPNKKKLRRARWRMSEIEILDMTAN